MGQLRIQGDTYLVNGQELVAGVAIRCYDPVAQQWYEGMTGEVSSYDFEQQQRVSSLSLVVEGYAPSPLQEGDTIEIVSEAQRYNREMDKRNRISAENRDKPWLPLSDGE